jgi:hypothetical protein
MEYLKTPDNMSHSRTPKSPNLQNLTNEDGLEYIRTLLVTMYQEQSEHLHAGFSEAYSKARNP